MTEIEVGKGESTHKLLDSLIQSTANKVVANRIFCIERGVAQEWENHISSYQQLTPIPARFAEEFRQIRNKVAGHVTYERIKKIDLTKFYENYHSYLYLMYRDCGDWWASRSDDFPDLEQVTDFFGAIARNIHSRDDSE